MKVDTSELLKGRTLEEAGGEEAPGLEEISYSLPEVAEHQGKRECR